MALMMKYTQLCVPVEKKISAKTLYWETGPFLTVRLITIDTVTAPGCKKKIQ